MFPGIKYKLSTFGGDLLGGITTAIVVLPLALAFGVASGIGAVSGLYTAIATCFFAAVFNGTPAQVTSPTGPMAIAMAAIVTQTATTLPEAFTIVMFAGVLQILIGVAGVGRYIIYTPYSVISGFMTGIGLIIITIQVPMFFGMIDAPPGAVGALSSVPQAIANVNLSALSAAIITLAICFIWPRKLRRVIPGTLVAIIIGTGLAALMLGDSPLIGYIPTELPKLQMPVISPEFLIRMIEPAFVLALIGLVDTMMTSQVTDTLTGRHHNSLRELLGQGFGNIFSGMIGGLPGAGSTVPSIVNIRSGGTTLVSGVVVSVILALFLLEFAYVAEIVPLAVLSGILVYTGWNVVDWSFVTRLHKIERIHVAVMLLTAFLTVFVDLIVAVALGLIASGLVSAKSAEQLQLDQVTSMPLADPDSDDPFNPRIGLVMMSGHFSVASANRLLYSMKLDIHDHDVVIVDFTETKSMDDSAVMLIKQLVEHAYQEGMSCVVMGMSGELKAALDSFGALDQIDNNNVAETLHDAKQIANRILDGKAA